MGFYVELPFNAIAQNGLCFTFTNPDILYTAYTIGMTDETKIPDTSVRVSKELRQRIKVWAAITGADTLGDYLDTIVPALPATGEKR